MLLSSYVAPPKTMKLAAKFPPERQKAKYQSSKQGQKVSRALRTKDTILEQAFAEGLFQHIYKLPDKERLHINDSKTEISATKAPFLIND